MINLFFRVLIKPNSPPSHVLVKQFFYTVYPVHAVYDSVTYSVRVTYNTVHHCFESFHYQCNLVAFMVVILNSSVYPVKIYEITYTCIYMYMYITHTSISIYTCTHVHAYVHVLSHSLLSATVHIAKRKAKGVCVRRYMYRYPVYCGCVRYIAHINLALTL